MSSGVYFRTMKGWLAGCGAATAVIVSFVWMLLAAGAVSRGLPVAFEDVIVGLSLPVGLVFVITCVLTGFPAIAVIWFSERFALRSIWFFACAGAVTGVVSQAVLVAAFAKKPWPPSFGLVIAVAGFAAGMAYWRIAGKHAGRNASGDLA